MRKPVTRLENMNDRTQKGGDHQTVPNCPSDVRWVALLPDPVTGIDAPVPQMGSGAPMVWTAPNLEMAVRLVRAALKPIAFKLCQVVQESEWRAHRTIPEPPNQYRRSG
jgi:hypothetical protein